ncbi:MAG TPA: response regulator [Caulobacteraceae bacterium]|jgi:signal transduction histidine kinase/DNA-binding response OmpR family regulator|nr:response regulator [Caulobacteraceae bacterium]
MTAEAETYCGIAVAARMRRRQLLTRVVIGCLIALSLNRLLGWNTVMPWLLIFLVAQLPEMLAFGPIISGKVERLPLWRNLLGCVGVALNGVAFGALSIPLWNLEGMAGGVLSALVISAAMLNAVVGTPGSRVVLACALGPEVTYLVATPFFMDFYGASVLLQAVTGLGCLGFAGYAVTLWNVLETSRRSEAEARTLAERKRAEAEAAGAAKSIYVATIGHELRTPISAMLAGSIELERAAKGSGLKAHATLIADAGRMMKTLLDDVLDHAKLDAGRMSMEATAFDLRAVVAQTARFWTAEARKKGLKLRVEGAATLPRWVMGDPTRLRQIVNNLISNAVKFTEKGSVSLKLHAWPSADEGVAVRLQVIDTGPGMDREQLSRLFTPFGQGDASIARNHGGTGLGLVISRQLAQLMGGQLTAYSVKGKGSTFTLAVTLPVAEAPAVPEAANESAPRQPVDGRALRVLAADDHEINRRAVQLILQPLGAEIVPVTDGLQALEKARAEAFDIIVMDVRMPGMDGREASRRIRAEAGPNQHTPIIAVTADTDKVDMEACRAAGMDWFVGKPLEPQALVQTVAQALERVDQAAEDAETVDDGTRPLRVLVADDHEINRKAVQFVLEPAGAEIVAVENGRLAYEATLAQAFDLIVMDVRMPEMNGHEATRRIRQTAGPNQNVPIIAVTAESDATACREAGMDWFVGKPIDPQTLMATVIEALNAANMPPVEDENGDEGDTAQVA